MTRQRASVACLALLLMVARQQQPPLAAAHRSGDPALPVHLAETGLFAPDGSGAIAAGNRPFAPQYPLWTDGAAKRRWIHLPAGTTIDASNARQWEFPVGTRLWKEFSFAGRPVETRLLWKASDAGWLAGSYVWNKEGTDAVLAEADGVAGAMEIAPGRQHNIPSRSDCAACHGEGRRPLGFNPLQLSNDRDPNAIHGEALTPDMVTLQTLFDEGLLTGADGALRQTPPRIAAETLRRAPCSDTCRAIAAPVTTATDTFRRSSRRSPTPTSSMALRRCGSWSVSLRGGRQRQI